MEAMHGLSISTVRSEGEVVISLRGELDFSVAPRFVEAVEAVLDDDTSVYAVDCGEVTFIDSESIKAILLLRDKLRRSSKVLGLQNCSAAVERIIRLLGLEEELFRE